MEIWELKKMELCPFGIGLEKPGVRTPWDMTGQKFQGLELKLKLSHQLFEILPSIYVKKERMVEEIGHLSKIVDLPDLNLQSVKSKCLKIACCVGVLLKIAFV